MIRRIEFDALLLSLAQEAGAEFCRASRLRVRTNWISPSCCAAATAARFEAPVVIAADGVNGVRGRRLRLNLGMVAHGGRDRHDGGDAAGSAAESRSRTLWVAYGYGGAEGYAYVFPKKTHVNVGIGYVLDYYRTRISSHPWDLQRSFTSELVEARRPGW